jgi:hypothetical protein
MYYAGIGIRYNINFKGNNIFDYHWDFESENERNIIYNKIWDYIRSTNDGIEIIYNN